ncbi:2'-5' RNA ligase family protein [Pseudalkalibacillus hwajinpoensis]|uniref:2'-5' RNA ligase family protein n=1 Tax=Guptibacillus hwajinpoensis TaxID=208199 RepID=UPI001CD7AC84|nr:2'-5' RNA ligase family protein [Pseudalkalibacillus hwajinpoensis]MCA0993355.1 2'-5' RNA ligase family protein [Pseudalkalibacillus hwajinpoensis]
MMYWFIALFDEQTEAQVKAIWQELKEQSLSYYIDEVKDGRPHITLASYEELDKEEYIRKIDAFYEEVKKVELTFNTISSFLNYGTIFLTPTVTENLLSLHSAHHHHFERFNGSANPLYLPGKWIPHCTLANDLSSEELAKVYQYCFDHSDTIYGRIEEVALIERIDESEEGMEAPIIYSKRLR